jgi:hypothetical protein
MHALAYVVFTSLVLFAIGMAVGYPCGRGGLDRRRALLASLAGFFIVTLAPFAIAFAAGKLDLSGVPALELALFAALAVACSLPYLAGHLIGYRWGSNLRAWSRSAGSQA